MRLDYSGELSIDTNVKINCRRVWVREKAWSRRWGDRFEDPAATLISAKEKTSLAGLFFFLNFSFQDWALELGLNGSM